VERKTVLRQSRKIADVAHDVLEMKACCPSQRNKRRGKDRGISSMTQGRLRAVRAALEDVVFARVAASTLRVAAIVT
jgi:hypothetical protein